ncbi:hypothetical protein WDW86_12645 [Bdellovibrionota bacterium FG-2]
MRDKSLRWRSVFFLVAAMLVLQGSAFAGISQIGFGYSTVKIFGNSANLLTRQSAYQGDVVIDQIGLGNSVEAFASEIYQSYQVNQLADVKLNFWGTFAGLRLKSPPIEAPSVLGVSTTLGFQAGWVWDGLKYTSDTGLAQNSATSFAARIVPGVEIPFFKFLNGSVEFPYTIFYLKSSALSTWSSVFSLRWKI